MFSHSSDAKIPFNFTLLYGTFHLSPQEIFVPLHSQLALIPPYIYLRNLDHILVKFKQNDRVQTVKKTV